MVFRQAVEHVPGAAVATGTCNVQPGVGEPYHPFKAIVKSLVRNPQPLARSYGEAMTVSELVVRELLAFPLLIQLFRPDVALGEERWERVRRRLGLMQLKESAF